MSTRRLSAIAIAMRNAGNSPRRAACERADHFRARAKRAAAAARRIPGQCFATSKWLPGRTTLGEKILREVRCAQAAATPLRSSPNSATAPDTSGRECQSPTRQRRRERHLPCIRHRWRSARSSPNSTHTRGARAFWSNNGLLHLRSGRSRSQARPRRPLQPQPKRRSQVALRRVLQPRPAFRASTCSSMIASTDPPNCSRSGDADRETASTTRPAARIPKARESQSLSPDVRARTAQPAKAGE
jgi:hypothetical protein